MITTTPAMTESSAPVQTERHVFEQSKRCPRQGVAAALVRNRLGGERVTPIIVIDFYREAAPQ